MLDSNETRANRSASRPGRTLRGLAGIGLCLVVGWLGVVAARPFVLAGRMRADNAKIEREIQAARLENQSLRKAVMALNTDAGREIEARRLGYVGARETRLFIPR